MIAFDPHLKIIKSIGRTTEFFFEWIDHVSLGYLYKTVDFFKKMLCLKEMIELFLQLHLFNMQNITKSAIKTFL